MQSLHCRCRSAIHKPCNLWHAADYFHSSDSSRHTSSDRHWVQANHSMSTENQQEKNWIYYNTVHDTRVQHTLLRGDTAAVGCEDAQGIAGTKFTSDCYLQTCGAEAMWAPLYFKPTQLASHFYAVMMREISMISTCTTVCHFLASRTGLVHAETDS